MMNKNLLRKACSMTIVCNNLAYLWSEVVTNAAYIVNKYTTTKMRGSPHKRFIHELGQIWTT